MVQYQDPRHSKILKKDVPQQRLLVKNQSSATRLGWKGVIKNVRLKISQQNTSLAMTQVPGSQQFWKIWVISCDLMNKNDYSSGFISGFFGLPGLPTWATRPGPNPLTPPARPNQPRPNCEAWSIRNIWHNLTFPCFWGTWLLCLLEWISPTVSSSPLEMH